MSFLTYECLRAYRGIFSKSVCFYGEPSQAVVVEDPDTGKAYIQPESETESLFFDRLDRSKVAGRNLFFEEWPVFEYDPDCEY